MRRLNIYLWVILSFLVALGAAVVIMPGAGSLRAATIAGALALSSGAAAFLAATAFGAAGRSDRRVPLLLLMVGMLLWFAVEALNLYGVARASVFRAYGTYTDVLWSIGSVFVIAALGVKVARKPATASVQAMAGALATAALALILAVNFVILPALRNPGLTPWERLEGVALAALNFALGTLALVVVATYGSRGVGRPWAQTALGLIFYAAANAIRWHLTEVGLYGPAGNVVTVLFWVAGYLLVGMGSYYRRLIFKGIIKFPAPKAEGPAE
jgi:hypothetical protein